MCNKQVLDFVRHTLPFWPAQPTVLEIGSYNVNGNARDVLSGQATPEAYIGIDLKPGPGVDIVADASTLDNLDLMPMWFDVAVSTEMLEHVQDWRRVLSQLEHRVKPGGLLLLTSCSPGFEYHAWPHDYWRFTLEDMLNIFGVWWDVLYSQTWIDPGQRDRTVAYHGVGVLAQRLIHGTSPQWEEWLATVEVHKAPIP